MAQTWVCPSCGQRRRTQFCAKCGEERLRPRDLTFADLAAHFLRKLSSVDGKLLRSSRTILMAPGKLTASYVRGERRRFLGPLELFLIANALFFAVQSLTSINILSSTLDSHLHVQDWHELAQLLVAGRLGDDALAVSRFAPRFDHAAVFNAKTLIFVMVLAFAPIAALLFRASHRAAGAHIIFSLHLYAFVLVVLCVSLVVAEADALMGGGGLASPNVDTWLSLFNLAAIAIYTYLAIGTAYGSTGVSRFVCAGILAVAVGVLLVGYRFMIFLITLYTA